jgi:hypothetical protein
MVHVAPPHSYHPQVCTSIGKVHPLSNPMVGHGLHLTQDLEGSSVFNTLELNVPSPFCKPIIQSPKLLNSQRNMKYLHVAPVFMPFGLSSILHPKPLESESPGLLKGPPLHVVAYLT